MDFDKRMKDLEADLDWFNYCLDIVKRDLDTGLELKYLRARREQEDAFEKLRVEINMLETQVGSVKKAQEVERGKRK